MSVISVQHGHGFIHVPKTGGTSMARTPFVGGAGHEPASVLRSRAPELFWWGFVRHPADRLWSTYCGSQQYPGWPSALVRKTFAEWIRSLPANYRKMAHTHPMTRYLCWDSGEVAVDFVGRFENYAEDWKEVCRRIGQADVGIGHVNKSARGPWQEEYTPEMLRIVTDIYAADFETFGYSLEGVKT